MNIEKKMISRIILYILLIPLFIFLTIFARALFLLQSKQELLNYKNATASVVLSSNGKLIGKIFTENRTNIVYEQIPDHLKNALIAVEDSRFYKHKGIDTRSLFRVFFKRLLLRKESAGGGSTITQQLAKNLFGRDMSGPFRMLVIKTKEAMLAKRIEKIYNKREILTLYLNTVPFGENVFGIEAAALRFFGKRIEDLKIEESAVLIGMLKANNIYNPRRNPERAKYRRNVVLNQMVKYNYLEPSIADSLKKLKLVINYSNIELNGPADYFIYQVKQQAKQILNEISNKKGKAFNIEEDGLIITTTLDIDLQKAANRAVKEHLSIMQKKIDNQYKSNWGKRLLNSIVNEEISKQNLNTRKKDIAVRTMFDWKGSYSESVTIEDSIRNSIKLLHAGLFAIDPSTGYVKAWVGGIDFKTHPFDQILARRQTGSTFKPLIYASAIEMGISPCFYLNNDSVSIPGYEDWHPQNFDHTYGGKYSLAGSLIKSMNIPTIDLFLKVGFDALNSLWNSLDFSYDLVNTPALALGTAEASIYEMAIAYSSFSNGGYKINPQIIISIKSHDGNMIWENDSQNNKTRVLSEKTCELINYILQRAVIEGTGSPIHSIYGINIPLAGKTGTTQEYSDAWFSAYNPSLVIISRVGASLPAIHFMNSSSGTGSSLALPLIGITMKQVQNSSQLSRKYSKYFSFNMPEIENDLACADYKDESAFDNFIDLFRRNRELNEKNDSIKRSYRKKRSFFRRLFNP